ncbi:hypothetical protein EON65_44420 [archaeon]|nr:MAG: hypothetical protein EON65_44420 [archaeon]
MRVVLLVPTENGSHLAVEITVDSMNIAQSAVPARLPSPASTAWSGVCKELACRNVAVHMGFVEKALIETLLDSSQHLFPLVCLIHNVRVVVQSDDLSLSSGLEISLDIGHVHIFANLTFLERLLGLLQHIKQECWWACSRLQQNPSSEGSTEGISVFDARAMWKAAMIAVLKKIKAEGKKFGGESFRRSLHKLILRRRYISLYQRLLLSSVGDRRLCAPLDDSELASLEELEILLCEADLIHCRSYVNCKAKRCGVSAAALRAFAQIETLKKRQQCHWLLGMIHNCCLFIFITVSYGYI